MPRIGLDFDNTIVCYDSVFHRAALDKGWISPKVPATKNAVRDELRGQGRESEWVALQGEVYGKRMLEAHPFPGAKDFTRAAMSAGIELFIVSHRTRYPFRGPHWDLHEAARDWIAHHLEGIALERVFFELTKEEKLTRISHCGCTHFVDDLPEILLAENFPTQTHALLFDPTTAFPADDRYTRVRDWKSLSETFDLVGATA